MSPHVLTLTWGSGCHGVWPEKSEAPAGPASQQILKICHESGVELAIAVGNTCNAWTLDGLGSPLHS